MGCIYDHIAVDWLPLRCHDTELVAEFDAMGWRYYRGTQLNLIPEDDGATIDALARDGEDYWTTTEWHVAHCLFTWRKQVRIGEGRSVEVEPWSAKDGHVKHCSEYIWNVIRHARPLDEVDTIIPGTDRHVNE
jgi:hypothetical protein